MMKKHLYRILSSIAALCMLIILGSCQKPSDKSSGDMGNATLNSDIADDNTDKIDSIKKLIASYLRDSPDDVESSDSFLIDEKTAIDCCNKFLSHIEMQISAADATISPLQYSLEPVWLIEDAKTSLECTIDANSGILLSVSGDIDIDLNESDIISICKEYISEINDKCTGLFLDNGNYYLTVLEHKMSDPNSVRMLHDLDYYSDVNDVMVVFSNDSTRLEDGNIAHGKGTARYFGINLALEEGSSYHPISSDYIFDAKIVEAFSDTQVTASDALSDSEAKNILYNDMDDINTFLPDKINLSDCEIERIGYNRISGGKCLQALYGFNVIEKSGQKFTIFITPDLKKITHIIYETDREYTIKELKDMSDSFTKYIGISPFYKRWMHGVFSDFSFAGNYLYETDNMDYHRNSVLAVKGSNKLCLYLSNNTKFYLSD